MSTQANLTINNNQMPGAFYLDANCLYAFDLMGTESTAFFSVRNMFDHDPPPLPNSAKPAPLV